jgi:hypothetical protein
MATTPIVPPSISPNLRLEGKVHTYGNLGYTSSRALGERVDVGGRCRFLH